VRFPYEPYRCQLDYMRTVLRALKTGTHAALESPTGTGKTLCLLCASCAWLLWHRSNPQNSESPAKILYTTRTHSQVIQVMNEFRRSGYAEQGIVSCVLGSREQLCVHPTVKDLRGHAMQAGCKNVRDNRACRFYNRTNVAPSPRPDRVLDIEDLVGEAQSKVYCPYYYSRETILPAADIVFCPYNYALDSAVKSHELKMSECVLILDEAHNLPSICLSTTSVEISTQDIAAAVADTSRAMDAVQRGHGGDVVSKAPEQTIQELNVLKKVWCNLERVIEQLPLELHKDTGCKVFLRPGDYVYEFLAQHNITVKTVDMLVKHVERAVEWVMGAAERSGFDGECRGLQRMLEILKFLFPSGDGSTPRPASGAFGAFASSYHFVVQENTARKSGRSLCLWCLDCSVCMRRVETEVRNVILTSGTLSPLDSFIAELGIPFPHILSGPHVISASQVYASIVSKAPNGETLNSSFTNRSGNDYKIGLGISVVNLCRTVPDGMLVFFTSYSAMNSAIEAWKAPPCTLWSDLSARKPPFIEPKTAQETRDIVRQYQASVDNGKGGVFFAVCRGKISEGIDFADRHGRCVVVIGIPFASRADLNVFLRRQHIDSIQKQRGGGITGDVWYRQDALRAVNQALGRVIRHRHDFGGVVLLDQRFTQFTKEISRWLQPYVTQCPEFSLCNKTITAFFASWKGVVTTPLRGPPLPLQGPAAVVPDSAVAAARFAQQLKEEEEDKLSQSVPARLVGEDFAMALGSVGTRRVERQLHPHLSVKTESQPVLMTPIPVAFTPQTEHNRAVLRRPMQLFGGDGALSGPNPIEQFLTKVRAHLGGTSTMRYDQFRQLLKEMKKLDGDIDSWKTICQGLADLLSLELLAEMRDVVVPTDARDAFTRCVPGLTKRPREEDEVEKIT